LRISITLATVFLGLLTTAAPAEARRHHHTAPVCDPWDIFADCRVLAPTPRARTHQRRPQAGSGSIVAHPAGCPRRAFCGCGASVRVFGHSVRRLWLAAAWLKFPSALPAPGMVAASFEHVFVLMSHIGGNIWLAYDANSGGHATRIHPRSIAGFSIVNPRT
jgi:hypothetical protein